VTTVIIGLVSVIAGGLFTYVVGPIVSSWLNSSKGDAETFQIRAEAGKTIGESYEGLLDRLEKTITTQGEQMAAQAEEIRELRNSVDELRVQASRFKVVGGLLPMADFMTHGLLAKLNDVVNEHGVHVSMYIDDIDGRVALGWRADAMSDLSLRPVPTSVKLSRAQTFDAMVAAVTGASLSPEEET
jgi:hypothetical protein